MTIQEKILEAMSRWLSECQNHQVKVYDYDEFHSFSTCGYDTCEFEEVEVHMYYTDPLNRRAVYCYTGSLSGLIWKLSE